MLHFIVKCNVVQDGTNLLKSRSILALAVLLLLLCLSPILNSKLYSDDIKDFQLRNSVAKISFGQIVARANLNVEGWQGSGRFSPVAIYLEEFVFFSFSDVRAYKIYILLVNILAVASFVFLLWSMGFSNLMSFFLFFYLGQIQFRVQMHDAFTTFNGMYQWLCILVFASAGLFLLYINRGKAHFYFIALLLSVLALLISEEGIVLFPILMACAFYKISGFRNVVKSILPFFVIYVIYFIYIYKLHETKSWSYPGLETNFNAVAIFNVIKIQVFSALPFSNLYGQVAIPKILFAQLHGFFNMALVVFIVVGAIILSLRLYQIKASGNLHKPVFPLIISCILLLVPAIILSPSVKYQTELWFGDGYLPVYIQNFGFALLMAVLAHLCLERGKLWSRLLLGGMLGLSLLSIVSSFLFNAALINAQNYNKGLPAEGVYRSINNGILEGCSPGSNIVLAGDYFYQAANVYKQIFKNKTARDFDVIDEEIWNKNKVDSTRHDCFLFECNKGDSIYTKLYRLDCFNGQKLMLIKCDTFVHSTRISAIEEPILHRRM